MIRKRLAPAAMALLLIGSVALVALAQNGPPQEQASFCITCHANLHIQFNENQPVVAQAPTAPHAINDQWTTNDCSACHRLQHNGKNATHGITESQQGGQYCATCHVTGEVPIDRDVPASFCASCHPTE